MRLLAARMTYEVHVNLSAVEHLGPGPPVARTVQMERPGSLAKIYFSRPDASLAAATSGHHWLVTRRVADAGIRRVYDRYITSPLQVHDLLLLRIRFLAWRRNPRGTTPPLAWRPDPGTAPLATAPCGPSIPAAAARTRSPPPRQSQWDDKGRSGSPASAAGTSTVNTLPSASRTAKNRQADLHGMHQSDEKPGCRIIGQNGRGPARGAVIRTASFARTLYTICTCTLPYIDPQ